MVEVQPGERFVQLIRQLFLLAQDGRTDARGRPKPLQRLLVGVLYPIARATGHRALDPAYLRRELPTVDLEPLPAEIVDLIPSLRTRPRWPNSTTASAGR